MLRPYGKTNMARYDPQKYHRRSIRLPGFDYARPGAYFVTICTYERECILGQIKDGIIIPSEYGRVVESRWHALPRHFPHVRLDAFVIMPNHVHGIIVLADSPSRPRSGRGEAFAANASPLQGTQPGSLGAIVQNFKSVTTRQINQMRGTPGMPLWQRNYYEHVIRNEDELNQIHTYIIENPRRWEWDENHPRRLPGTVL